MLQGKDNLSEVSSIQSRDSTEMDFWESYSSDPCSTEPSIHLVSPLDLLEARLKLSKKAIQVLENENENLKSEIKFVKEFAYEVFCDILSVTKELQSELKRTSEELAFVKAEKSKIRIVRRLVYKPISTKLPPVDGCILDDFLNPPEPIEPIKKSVSDEFIRSLVIVIGMFALGFFCNNG